MFYTLVLLVRSLLGQVPRVDGDEVVEDHCEHGESTEAVRQVVKGVVGNHSCAMAGKG